MSHRKRKKPDIAIAPADRISWVELPAHDLIERLPSWVRTVGLDQVEGCILVSAVLGAPEEIVFARGMEEKVPMATHKAHLYVIKEWMMRVYPTPEVKFVCESIFPLRLKK